jgi:hypothetical protein
VVRRAHLLITGTYRSGTTFAERLIDNLSDAYCAPQPFPYLYLSAKRRYLAQLGRGVSPYPIGTGFHDPLHQPEELAAFLATEVFSQHDIVETFESMRGYSGAQMPVELEDVVGRIPEGTFVDVVRGLHELLAERVGRPAATLLASKEFLLEEFVPTFANAGIGMMVVVRDPRAVVASTVGPDAKSWSGRPRPLLFSIRLWRKSIAYALRFRDSVVAPRLEDLSSDPEGALTRSLDALGLDITGRRQGPILSVRGKAWQPNTSFPDGGGADGPRFGLSDRQLAYVEAVAGPEMRAFGYQPVGEGVPIDDALGGLRPEDDPGGDHPIFEPNFSVAPAQLTLERERLALLRTQDPIPDESSWFVLPGVRARLASVIAEQGC